MRTRIPAALLATLLAALTVVLVPSGAEAAARITATNEFGKAQADTTYATKLTLRARGFQSIRNGHGGIYVFFGTVKGTWRPSQGGQTGRDYLYVPDSEAKNNAGYQRFIAFPGSDTAASANGGTVSAAGRWSTTITVPGATFQAVDRDGGTRTVDCRKVTCGSCRTRILSGAVSYTTTPTAPVAADEALICCSIPAAPEDGGAAPLYIVLNGADEDVELTFPEWPDVGRWVCVLDTANGETDGNAQLAGAAWKAKPRSVLAFAGLR